VRGLDTPRQADDFELLTILCWALNMVLSNHKLCFLLTTFLQTSIPIWDEVLRSVFRVTAENLS